MSEIIANELTAVPIEAELKRSYLDYAMSVIIDRALPDIRDGLKRVHRRVLYSMETLGNSANKPHRKSVRIVGDVLAKYHPHGDAAVYDTIVRMAQPFSMRYLLIDGQGNFGSIDGDEAAAMRYTEARMTPIAHAMLADLDKETVEFVPNFDGNETEPTVLPTRIPNLLINGISGIAVGMATNIPPHNLTEVLNACLALLENPELTVEELMHYLPGPDFPTAATIQGRQGILEAYQTGRGRVTMRAVTEIELDEKSNKQRIIVTELPYQVNKAKLVAKIAELVRDKRIEGITGLRDESNREGMRIVIEVRRGDVPDVILNNLFTHTVLQTNFYINMMALKKGMPLLCNLKDLLGAFLSHRREVITRRTLYELRKAKERAHLLEGLSVALANIDEVVALIRASRDTATAKAELLRRPWNLGGVKELLAVAESIDPSLTAECLRPDNSYQLSEVQAQAILDLRLHRLTGLEQDKLLDEYRTQMTHIKSLLEILNNPDRLQAVLREELTETKETFGDERRTRILDAALDINSEDLIPKEDRVITVSHEGYTKTQSLTSYHAQRRGGKGKSASDIKEEDFIEQFIIANSHEMLVCFSSAGRAYWLKTYQLPQGGRTARGRPIVNLLPLREDEKIHAILPVNEYLEGHYIFMATAHGTVKKTPLVDFSRPRKDGIMAIDLDENDYLIGVALTDGKQDVLLFTDAGKVIRFQEDKVRAMGRTARGVRGVKLGEGQKVISLIIAQPGGEILTVTENGYGKRTPIEEHRVTGRGGQGIIAIKESDRNGKMVAALQVTPQDEVMLITNRANLVRTNVEGIRRTSRASQGVRLIRLEDQESLVAMQRIAE
jgi:DNA gyrase subunit A